MIIWARWGTNKAHFFCYDEVQWDDGVVGTITSWIFRLRYRFTAR